MPPKAPPASRAPIAVRNLANESKAKSKIASPRGSALGSLGTHNTGNIVALVTVAAKTSTGIA